MPRLAPGTPAAATLRAREGFSSRLPLVCVLLLLAPALHAAEGAVPGAYCPLPEPGEVPRCLDPAKQAYGEFFEALEDDAVEEEALSGVEAAVARGAEAEEAYLALSSLTYGYYRLAQRAASAEDADPAVVQRLSRWNALLAHAYHSNATDADYQASVERAARELRDRTRVSLPCRDGEGGEAACTSTEAVIRGFNARTEAVGVRGALERLLQRFFGGAE